MACCNKESDGNRCHTQVTKDSVFHLAGSPCVAILLAVSDDACFHVASYPMKRYMEQRIQEDLGPTASEELSLQCNSPEEWTLDNKHLSELRSGSTPSQALGWKQRGLS